LRERNFEVLVSQAPATYAGRPMLLVLLLVFHFVCAGAIVYGLNWLALIPWRKLGEVHWTVRARLLWPVRRASGILMVSVPGALAAAQIYWFPEIPLVYALAAMAGVMGAMLGTWPMARAVFPERTFGRWLRDLGSMFIVRILLVCVWVGAVILMPREVNRETFVIPFVVIVFTLWQIYGGSLWLLRTAGLLVAPSERLIRIVQEVADSMGLPLPRIWELRGFGANAIAFPAINTLVVTEGLLAALPNEELSAVCAHEFGHLSEPKRVVFMRILSAFVLLPGIYFKPVIAAWGFTGYLVLLIAVVLISRSVNAFRRRMEKRADSVAAAYEGLSEGTYARALERVYEINQIPAVISGPLTHPHLYDRLLAAGVTPTYPRPAAPARFSWSFVVAMLLLIVSAATAILLADAASHEPRAAMRSQHQHPQ
jgi:Zn-dependent protease with chaperone function